MLRDFHYNCVKVLSRYAGFCEEEAEIIAYASQYVDDANYHDPITIINLSEMITVLQENDIPLPVEPFKNKPLFNGKQFDPVCTAHKNIKDFFQIFFGQHDKISKTVYVPFHFIPPKEHQNFEVKPDSDLAKELVTIAMDELNNKTDKPTDLQRLKSLIKLGIALHSYADTFNHYGFSGFWDCKLNDIENLYICNSQADLWKEYSEKGWGIVPDIGHGEAGDLPDISFLTWGFQKDHSQKFDIRNNTDDFLTAAENIYQLLCSSNSEQWDKIKFKIRSMLSYAPSYEVEPSTFSANSENFLLDRCNHWLNVFPAFFSQQYDEKLWGECLEKRKVDIYESKDLNCFLFHIAACEQKTFIKQQLGFKN